MGLHRPKERNDVIYMAKVFSKSIDGEFDYPDNYTWKSIYGRRYDRKYLKYRLLDEILEKSNNNSAYLQEYKCETGYLDDVYIVVSRCKKGTKLEKALVEMGFNLIKAVE